MKLDYVEEVGCLTRRRRDGWMEKQEREMEDQIQSYTKATADGKYASI
jgi:hypothetical protein